MTPAVVAARLERLVNALWYRRPRPWHLTVLFCALVPFSLLHALWQALRRHRPPVSVGAPVVVVGNLTVGGTGKTPFVMWLAARCHQRGIRVGIIARGATGHGRASPPPQRVQATSDPAVVGDEALLLYATGVPVAVHRQRRRAAAMLIGQGCELLVSDDGLQHAALPAALRIVMVDGERGFGNGWLLPAGPLRQPARHLQTFDLRVGTGARPPRVPVDIVMGLVNAAPRPLCGGEPNDWTHWHGIPVHALAGIGNPERFFAAVRAHLDNVTCHAWPDHHPYAGSEPPLNDPDAVVFTTSKDAVRLAAVRPAIRAQVWVVPVDAIIEPADAAAIDRRIDALVH